MVRKCQSGTLLSRHRAGFYFAVDTGKHDRTEMKSEVIRDLASQAVSKKRSVIVGGHRTSVSLEPIFWDQLRTFAAQRRITVNELVTEIDQQRSGSLTSAIRVFVLESVRKSGSSSENPTHGDQGDSAYNGHFGCTW